MLVTAVTRELDARVLRVGGTLRRDQTMSLRRGIRGAGWVRLAAALVLCSCGARPAPAPPAPKVKVVQPVAREITEWDEYTARLDAVDSVEVRPRVSGYLQSIHFTDGALVKAGDLLFLIDSRPYDAVLRHAEADLEFATSQLELATKNF